MGDNLIDFRGRSVMPGWPEMLASFQRMTHVMIGGKRFQRVRYGEEDDDYGAGDHPCRDCAAIAGEFHGFCVIERCPSCGGQASSCECDCDDETEEPNPEPKPPKAGKKVAPTAAQNVGAARTPKAAAANGNVNEARKTFVGSNKNRRERKIALIEEFARKGANLCGCVFCGLKISFAKRFSVEGIEEDKIINTKAGGRYRVDNLLPSCGYCSISRGEHDALETIQASQYGQNPNFDRSTTTKQKPKAGAGKAARIKMERAAASPKRKAGNPKATGTRKRKAAGENPA